MKCIKKFAAVAVVLLVTASSSFAGWDKFSVIEAGKGEAKFGFYGEGMGPWLGVRYGLMENLELFSTTGTGFSDYAVGVRYQIAETFAAFLDLDIPTALGNDYYPFGLTPGINFTMPFTETISFGSIAKIGIGLSDPVVMNLDVGVEVDIMLSENIGCWIGVDFTYDRMTQENREDLDFMAALAPGFGFFFSADNLTVGTLVGLKLNHVNSDGDDTVALTGGVEFSVSF